MTNGFGEQLKSWRKERALNQKAAAAHFGIEQSYYSKIERGTHMPSVDVLARIAEIVGLSLDDAVLSVAEPGPRYHADGAFQRNAPVGALIGGVRTLPGDKILFSPDLPASPQSVIIARIDGDEFIGVIAEHPTEREARFWPFGQAGSVALTDATVIGVATALHRPL